LAIQGAAALPRRALAAAWLMAATAVIGLTQSNERRGLNFSLRHDDKTHDEEKESEAMLLVYLKMQSLRPVVAALCLVGLAQACSLEPAPPRTIRGHQTLMAGVAHGSSPRHAERYCQGCHGATLAGGIAGEPSCYQCHGTNWESRGALTAFAPPTHTDVKDGMWLHHPGATTPLGTCAACHGTDLSGSTAQNTPSCYLCHDQLWD
jgi:hypothetical protein